MVTPAAISSSFLFCLMIALTSASSLRVLMPRISRGVVHDDGFDRQLPPAIDGNQVGQIVLALGVPGRDGSQRVEQRCQVERVDAAVDFLDALLGRRGIALLDDPRNPAADPDDAAVAVRAFNRGRNDRGGGLGSPVGIQKAMQGRGLQERHIAREQTPQCPSGRRAAARPAEARGRFRAGAPEARIECPAGRPGTPGWRPPGGRR